MIRALDAPIFSGKSWITQLLDVQRGGQHEAVRVCESWRARLMPASTSEKCRCRVLSRRVMFLRKDSGLRPDGDLHRGP